MSEQRGYLGYSYNAVTCRLFPKRNTTSTPNFAGACCLSFGEEYIHYTSTQILLKADMHMDGNM